MVQRNRSSVTPASPENGLFSPPALHAQLHWLSRITFLGPLTGKSYMGEDATVGSSREDVFRNHRFLLFPGTIHCFFFFFKAAPRQTVKQIK